VNKVFFPPTSWYLKFGIFSKKKKKKKLNLFLKNNYFQEFPKCCPKMTKLFLPPCPTHLTPPPRAEKIKY
jgi:hypothetical protein